MYLLVLVQVVRDETEHDAVGDQEKEDWKEEKDKLVNSAIKVAAPVVFMGYLIITSITTTSTYFIPNLGLAGAHLGAASSTIMVIRVIRKGMA